MTNSNPGHTKPKYGATPASEPDPLDGMDAQAILAIVYSGAARPIPDTARWVQQGKIAAEAAARRGF